jgi:hypothetical protein
MGRLRVVNITADTGGLEVGAQRVARSSLHHIEMVDMALLIDRKAQGQASEELGVPSGTLAPGSVTSI